MVIRRPCDSGMSSGTLRGLASSTVSVFSSASYATGSPSAAYCTVGQTWPVHAAYWSSGDVRPASAVVDGAAVSLDGGVGGAVPGVSDGGAEVVGTTSDVTGTLPTG